jgi:hypothetical protein
MAGLSGNPYDWGLDKVANNMASLNESISRDRALKEQENTNKILNQRNLFAMEKERQQEERLGKKVQWGTMIRAKGGSEKAAQNAIEYARSLGVGDELGNVELRNMPFLLETMDKDKQFKISQHDINDADLAEAETGIRDEIKKIEENKYTNPEKFAKDAEILPQKIKMADQLKARRASIQAQKNELLGLKQDNSLTEWEVRMKAASGDPNAIKAVETKSSEKTNEIKPYASSIQDEAYRLVKETFKKDGVMREPQASEISEMVTALTNERKTAEYKAMKDVKDEGGFASWKPEAKHNTFMFNAITGEIPVNAKGLGGTDRQAYGKELLNGR